MKVNYMSFTLRTLSVAAVASSLVLLSVIMMPTASAGDTAPGRYIVVLKDSVDTDTAATDLSVRHGLAIGQRYHHAINGFAASVPAGKLAALQADARVAFVSEDRQVSISAEPVLTAKGKPGAAPQPAQSVPTGLRRIHAEQNANEGAGVTVAVIDTGIDLAHPDLSGRIVANKNCLSTRKNGNDDNGHGTHVAGTIAALDNSTGSLGIASASRLAAVKVLNAQGSGMWSSIICGLDWVAANSAALDIKVANMSLGGSGSSDGACGLVNGDALHQAVCRVRDAGVTVVVAAGNEGADTAGKVPAGYDDAVITVSALADSDGLVGGLGSVTSYGPDDTFATFSNYGSAVDIGAPGVAIYSTWKGSAYNTISGTSMASPHVAAAAAMYLSSNPGATWIQVRDALVATGEALGAGHTDLSGRHAEPVLNAASL
jgi:subtilisin